MRYFMKQKGIKKPIAVLAAFFVILGVLASPFMSFPVYADDAEDDHLYNLSYYRVEESGNFKYEYTASFVSTSLYPLFLFHSNDGSYEDLGYRYYSVGVFTGSSCYQVSDVQSLGVFNVFYTSKTTQVSNGSVLRDVTEAGKSLNQSCSFQVKSESDYTCDSYVFESLSAANAFFISGSRDGIIRDPGAPDPEPDDPALDPDIDPDSLIGKVLALIRSIFKDWSFTEFLNFFSTAIFGNWDYDVFLDMIKNAMFGTQKYKDIYDFFEEKTNGWDFNTIVDMIREGMFGAQKFKDIYDFFEQKTNGWDFNAIVDMIREGMFGTGKIMTLYDFFSKFLDDLGLSTIAEDIKDIVRAALIGDEDHSLLTFLFVPDEDVLQVYLSDFLNVVQENFPGIMKLIGLGEQVIDTVKVASGSNAPSFTIELGKSASYDLGNANVTIDFSWYAPYKPTVDLLLAGIIWLGFIWRMYSRIPEILSGAGMIVSVPFVMERHEIQNSRLEESRRRSDIRWEVFQEAQARRRKWK